MTALPFTALEHFFYEQSCPAHPLQSSVVLDFLGELDRPALERALAVLAPRHPLLTANIHSKNRWGVTRHSWQFTADAVLPVVWKSVAEKSHFSEPATDIPIEKDNRACFHIYTSPTHTRMVFICPHARMDGKGMEQVFQDLFVLYASEVTPSSESKWQLPPLESQHLTQRLLPGRKARDLLSPPTALFSRICIALESGQRRPERLSENSPSDLSQPVHHKSTTAEFTLSSEELRAYRKQGSINSLLLRDLFLSIQHWKKNRKPTSDQGGFRVVIPADCRPLRGPLLSTCNSMSMIFMDRLHSEISDPHTLQRSIQDQMSLIRQHKYYDTFIFFLNSYYQTLPLVRLTSSKSQYLPATLCFSNVGKIFRTCPLPRMRGKVQVGNLLLEKARAWTPTMPCLDASFCVMEYAGELHIYLRYDPQALSPADAQEFCSLFRKFIIQSISSNNPQTDG